MSAILEAKLEAPDKASQSLLARLDVCVASGALYLKYRDDGVPTAPLVRGEICHEFAERATHYCIEQGEQSMPPEVGKDFMQALIEERADFALPAHEQDACRIFAWNWAAATVLELEKIVAVEDMFELEVAGWTVRGRIDRAEISGGEAFVRDYKSSLYIPAQEVFEQRFQTPFYALLFAEGVPEGEDVRLGEGLSGVHVFEEYPRWRGDDGDTIKRHAYLDHGQLHDVRLTVESHLLKLERGLITGEWAATIGPHCATCPAPHDCPIPAERRPLDNIGTEAQAAELAEQVPFRLAALKRDQEALKAWVKEHGDLIVGEDRWTFVLEPKEVANKEAIKLLIERYGHDVDDFFTQQTPTVFRKKAA